MSILLPQLKEERLRAQENHGIFSAQMEKIRKLQKEKQALTTQVKDLAGQKEVASSCTKAHVCMS